MTHAELLHALRRGVDGLATMLSTARAAGADLVVLACAPGCDGYLYLDLKTAAWRERYDIPGGGFWFVADRRELAEVMEQWSPALARDLRSAVTADPRVIDAVALVGANARRARFRIRPIKTD